MSTIVGNIVTQVKGTNPDIPPNVVASALALISGCIIVAIGLARCGWIVDLISLTAISAFMTGSALNIAIGQVPALMGQTGFSSRDSTYLVVINILSHLNSTTLDAAMGLTALAMLYIIRSACKLAAKRFPGQQKEIFFASTLRTVFVILLYTLISWLVNRNVAAKSFSKAKFKILGPIPRGNTIHLVNNKLLTLDRFPKRRSSNDKQNHH
jgi:solute carrier family 26 (sodium-independent sulfate anion transporter), member 11